MKEKSFETKLKRFAKCRVNQQSGRDLGGEEAGATDSLDGLLGVLGEETSLDDEGLVGELTGTEDLEVTLLGDVDDRGLGLVRGELEAILLGDKGPDLFFAKMIQKR